MPSLLPFSAKVPKTAKQYMSVCFLSLHLFAILRIEATMLRLIKAMEDDNSENYIQYTLDMPYQLD